MRRLAVVAVLIVAAGCSKPPVAPTGSTDVRVAGRILDYGTGAAVANARVVFQDFGSDGRYVAVANALSDASGAYAVTVPAGDHQPFVDGEWIGQLHMAGTSYPGDFFVHWGTCVARYGTVVDAQTLRPIAGATVSVTGPGIDSRAVSGADGWYRIDLGCPGNGQVGFNTTDILTSHPNYLDSSKPAGRGVAGVTRVDFQLEHR